MNIKKLFNLSVAAILVFVLSGCANSQFAKKYNAKIVPIYIERIKDNNFKIKVYKSLQFSKEESLENITLSLNKILEDMIIKNPEQWIWTHSRWK